MKKTESSISQILLVNDEAVQRHRLASLLRKAGHEVVEAEDGLAALEAIESGLEPALVITDLYMPRLDGWQLCREIRERGLSCPILVISAFFESEEITDLLKALGANDFLRVPAQQKDLLCKVTALLKGQSGLREEAFSLLFVSPSEEIGDGFLPYLRQTGFRVWQTASPKEACKILKQQKIHLVLLTSHLSPDDLLTLKRLAPKTSFLVLMVKDTGDSPFRYVLKGACHVVNWPGEAEFLNYLCHRELREQAFLLGQKLLRERTRELERVSAELQRLRQILHIVVEQAEMGVVVTNREMEPLFCNPTALSLMQSVTSGPHFLTFLTYLLGEDPKEEIWACLTKEGRYYCEVQVSNGQKIFIFIVKPLYEKEKLAGLVFFIQDVTQERDWQKRLAHMQKMEALATLTAGIAHDFNNLLGAIRLKAELLQSKVSPEHLYYIVDIISICDRAARVVQQIMAVSRPSMRSEVTNLNLQVKETLSFLQETIPRGIRLQIFLTPEPLLVRLEAGQMFQIILNLCLNAVQAMGDTGCLTIKTGRDEYHSFYPFGYLIGNVPLQGHFAWLQVTDTGCGISAEILPRIFDPYFTTKGPQAGTGLGLAMTANIVETAGGAIAVETALNHGSSFTIFLPLERPFLPLQESTLFPENKILRTCQGRLRVLLVEDEEMIREPVKEFLEEQGFEIVACKRGEEVLELLQKGYHPEVAVIDLNMPGLAGLEVVQELRKCPRPTKIIIVAGRIAPEEAATLKRLDISKILLKPFSLERLHATICEALERNQKG